MKELIKISVVKYNLPFMIKLPNDEYKVHLDNISIIVKLQGTKSPHNMSGMPKRVSFPEDIYRWENFIIQK